MSEFQIFQILLFKSEVRAKFRTSWSLIEKSRVHTKRIFRRVVCVCGVYGGTIWGSEVGGVGELFFIYHVTFCLCVLWGVCGGGRP